MNRSAIKTTDTPKKATLALFEPVKGTKKGFKRGADIGLLEFQFNPKDIATALQAGWNFKPNKTPGDPPEFTGTQLRSFDMEVFLDATGRDDADVTNEIELLFSTVRPTPASVTAKTPFPPIVLFSWGVTKAFLAVVKGVSVTMTLFRIDGRPLRATCKVQLQEYPDEPGKTNPTSGARQSDRAHQVVLGDTLASIANAAYGFPTMWRAIATVNDLEDPFELPIGAELLIPPADLAAGLC
jgi:hypothetical protein